MTYLHDTRGCPDHWYPRDNQKRALVDKWLHWHHGAIRPAAMIYFEQSTKPLWGGETNPATIATYKDMFTRGLDVLEPTLSAQRYICGDEISVADLNSVMEIYHLTILNFDYSGYPNVIRWMNDIITMPGVAKAHLFFEKIKAKANQAAKI